MKLYTELQVRKIIDIAEFNRHLTYQDVLDGIFPIELPTDDEIRIQACMYSNQWQEYRAGAKWIKEQILNQNK